MHKLYVHVSLLSLSASLLLIFLPLLLFLFFFSPFSLIFSPLSFCLSRLLLLGVVLPPSAVPHFLLVWATRTSLYLSESSTLEDSGGWSIVCDIIYNTTTIKITVSLCLLISVYCYLSLLFIFYHCYILSAHLRFHSIDCHTMWFRLRLN